jgi:N,N'-diacetyllegionaminate synthase
MKKTFIIAEAGVNHNGDINLAYKLIDKACEAGVDAVKFQTWKTEKLLTKLVEKAEYQKQTTDSNESQFDMIKKLELPFEDFRKLKNYCDLKNIEFMSSCADNEALDFLISIGINKIKTSSADLTNYPFLKHIASYNKELIISTGMATMEEIKASVKVLLANGQAKNNINILHCNSEYPTPFSDVNLRAMLSIKEELNVDVGYSDHTEGIEVPIAAVSIGAKIIEKHFTLDKSMDGPDHKASLNPIELNAMVFAIRNIEKALGAKEKNVSPSEMKNINLVRKSIVASNKIKEGECFTEKNLTVKRPGIGISPMQWDNVIGSIAKKDFEIDDLISL